MHLTFDWHWGLAPRAPRRKGPRGRVRRAAALAWKRFPMATGFIAMVAPRCSATGAASTGRTGSPSRVANLVELLRATPP